MAHTTNKQIIESKFPAEEDVTICKFTYMEVICLMDKARKIALKDQLIL